MFHSVDIKRTDTCLTFVLKRLGILDKYQNLDGVEFIKKFNLEEIENFDNLQKGDIIVRKSNRNCYKNSILKIDEKGRTFNGYFDNSYHFMVFEGDAISDFGYHGIGYYKLDFFDIKNSKSLFYVIRNSDLN